MEDGEIEVIVIDSDDDDDDHNAVVVIVQVEEEEQEDDDNVPCYCDVCGHIHGEYEIHEYEYVSEIDDELMCHICLSALVDPRTIPCGHTFCDVCLRGLFRRAAPNGVKPCPDDRKGFTHIQAVPSSVLVRNLVGRLLVICPNKDRCEAVMPREQLKEHLARKCPTVPPPPQKEYQPTTSQGSNPPNSAIDEITPADSPQPSTSRATVPSPMHYTPEPIASTSRARQPSPGAYYVPEPTSRARQPSPTRFWAIEGSESRSRATGTVPITYYSCLGTSLYYNGYPDPNNSYATHPGPNIYRAMKRGTSTFDLLMTSQKAAEAGPSTSGTQLPGATSNSTDEDVQDYEELKRKGITRLPVLEGEISHIEIPRLASNLGITIVGGADTALRCVVVQEVFPDGLVSQDGRLKPGDQLIEINGIDMTNASHHQACQALRKMIPVLRLGVYRERIEAYGTRSSVHYVEEVHTVTLVRQENQQLGVRLSGWWMEHGIFILEIIPGSPAARSGQLEPYDRILSVNGEDVSNVRLDQASRLIQNSEEVTLVVARKKLNRSAQNREGGALPVYHGRTKSAPEALGSSCPPSSSSPTAVIAPEPTNDNANPSSQTWQAKLQQLSPDRNMNTHSHSHSCDSLQNPSSPCSRNVSLTVLRRCSKDATVDDVASNIKRNLQFEGIQLQQKCVTINKEPSESLGMRIGGGIGSNEGDIPIYIANIHPQGCVGKTQQIWKGDILLNVNGTSLLGLTHTQAVATLKATVENTQVTLGVLEGPETSLGSLNFIPSWLYWQKLPRCLQFPKTVILHRSPGASLGFSIVGGEDPVRGPEAIHILFVVQDSPAAKHGKLRCGDRLLAVDGHSLENVKHSTAVAMLKQTGSKVMLEVVSWLGTEL